MYRSLDKDKTKIGKKGKYITLKLDINDYKEKSRGFDYTYTGDIIEIDGRLYVVKSIYSITYGCRLELLVQRYKTEKVTLLEFKKKCEDLSPDWAWGALTDENIKLAKDNGIVAFKSHMSEDLELVGALQDLFYTLGHSKIRMDSKGFLQDWSYDVENRKGLHQDPERIKNALNLSNGGLNKIPHEKVMICGGRGAFIIMNINDLPQAPEGTLLNFDLIEIIAEHAKEVGKDWWVYLEDSMKEKSDES